MEKEIVRISVRDLVEFILRSGDLDLRKGGFSDREAMQKGSAIHRKIQKSMPVTYQPEVPLRFEKEFEELTLVIEGRADGIQSEDGDVTIDEIKGVHLDLGRMTEPVPVHLAQAKCYAYIYGTQNQLEQIRVQMTYCHMETEEILHFQEMYTLEALTEWFEDLVRQYYRWAKWRVDWCALRNASMEGLEFPFPYRPGQRDVVTGVYRTILRKQQLFIQAPTGVGKTMSTLFPAVRSMGEGLTDRIFYLTARTVTGRVAWEAFDLLRSKGLRCKTLAITAKEKLCVCDEVECNPDACPRAKGHYDRINDAVFSLLQIEDQYDRETILRCSEEHRVCPYEMCLDLADWVDGIICDYNYVFDPKVYLRRFFGEGMSGKYVFLMDEAHNLVERGREMYSAELYKEDFLKIRALVKGKRKKLERYLTRCNQLLLEFKRECAHWKELESLGGFPLALLSLQGELEEYLEDLPEGPLRKDVLEFYFQIRHFQFIYELVDENYVIYGRHDADGRFLVKLFCVNPAVNLQNCLNKGISAVFFSATMLPIRYYRSLLSGRTDDYAIYAKSPFSSEQSRVVLCRDVSSRYTRRGREEYERIAGHIHQTVTARKGNYLVFFPSYRMLEDIRDVYEELFGWEDCAAVCQVPSMGEADREQFLENFSVEHENGLMGFCVMGGIFSEGIDLTGDRLVGAIVVGTGLPQVGDEREILKNYYDRNGENGFDYAYRFPGMNKVLQAAGRVIRTDRDRGVIVLLDDRFCSPDYRRLFPLEWSEPAVVSGQETRAVLEKFWNSGEEKSAEKKSAEDS